jgi:adenine/guanine phosphoribosyltransferase-like PRPP-binding protein
MSSPAGGSKDLALVATAAGALCLGWLARGSRVGKATTAALARLRAAALPRGLVQHALVPVCLPEPSVTPDLVAALAKRGLRPAQPGGPDAGAVVVDLQAGWRDVMTPDACAAYVGLHVYRALGDVPEHLSPAVFIPAHPEQRRNGRPYLNTLALLVVPALRARVVAMAVAAIQAAGGTMVCAFETRAMSFGVLIAAEAGLPFIAARKRVTQAAQPGLAPKQGVVAGTDSYRHDDVIDMDSDTIGPSDHVVVFDDVINTGATVDVVCTMVRSTGAQVSVVALVHFGNPAGGLLGAVCDA